MPREVTVKFSLGDDVAKQEFEEWLQTAGDHVYLVDMPEASSPVQLEAEKRAFERDPDEPTAHIARALDELANYNDGEYALVDMLSCAWLALSRAHSFAQSSLPGLPGWPKDTMVGLKSAHATVTELLREDAAGA